MNTRLGHYDIVEELGRGGMGVVYKGYESSLGRYVAIKVLSAAMVHDKVFVERFLREARAMATLNDSHIVQIYFIGQDEAQTFFVMEYIDGEALSTTLKREKKLQTGDALKILLHASQGLASAHAQGVIHRDVKPGNIMVTSRGQVKVGDFGIALANHDVSSKLTNTGAFVGTPGYLSPEVCLGKAVDQRSDIFALGIVLFEMLTGRMPFHDDSPLRLMLDVVQADAPDVREINADVDDEIVRILGRMLAKDPADRYQSCDELNADLKKHPLVMGGGQLSLRPAPFAGANASTPTVIGAPTSLTPVNVPRAATPPPVVSSARTPSNPQPTVTAPGAALPAAAPAVALSRPGARSMLLLVGVLIIAVLGWVIGRTSPGKFDAVVVAPTITRVKVTPPPAPPAPGQLVPVASSADAPAPIAPGAIAAANAELANIGSRASGDAAMDAAVDGAAALPGEYEPREAVATVLYGHAGKNSKLNRVRVRPEKEKSAEDIAREEARKRTATAALAVAELQAAPAVETATPASAAGDGNTKTKRGFLCRVFKKCDPPKRPAAGKPVGSSGG